MNKVIDNSSKKLKKVFWIQFGLLILVYLCFLQINGFCYKLILIRPVNLTLFGLKYNLRFTKTLFSLAWSWSSSSARQVPCVGYRYHSSGTWGCHASNHTSECLWIDSWTPLSWTPGATRYCLCLGPCNPICFLKTFSRF